MIHLLNVTKRFDTRQSQAVVDDISMRIEEGELCVLLGPSGCGKTTTLKMINRLVQPTSGRILIGGEDTAGFDVVELRRRIGYVIQQVGLFPNMTVEENIVLVPRMLGWDKRKIRRRTETLLELVALDPAVFLRRYPRDLSGGQQQRVGVARSLAADPPVMLMDEPFGAIDPINRTSIQDEFRKIQRTLRKTVVFVSHDIDEAMKMADKVAIFRDGKIDQFAEPDALLARPANSFVADFVGSDRALKRLRLLRARDAVVSIAGGGSASTVAAHDITVSADEDLRTVMSMMLAHGASRLAVIDQNSGFLGHVTLDRVAEMARADCSDGAAVAAVSRASVNPAGSALAAADLAVEQVS